MIAFDIEKLLQQYQLARKQFAGGNFRKADSEAKHYKSLVDYRAMPHEDRREKDHCRLSVIIVSYNQGRELIRCLDSLDFPETVHAEIILIDNGKNESVHAELARRPLLHFLSPINFAPAEARNIGAHFAHGEILVFLDDDAVAEPGFLDSIHHAFTAFDFLAIRGRIPGGKTQINALTPKHYDPGKYPFPSLLLTEGNMAVPREYYLSVGGMHPLMFGMEGVEFSWRLLRQYRDRDIYYWPLMRIRHDYGNRRQVFDKKERGAVARDYLQSVMGAQADLSAQYSLWQNDRPGPSRHYQPKKMLLRFKYTLYDTLFSYLYQRKKK